MRGSMTLKLYHYPRCSTCVKARKFLAQHDLKAEEIDLAQSPPDEAGLRAIHRASQRPFKALFNTSGQSYRGGDFKTRLPKMSEDEAFAALAADGMLIKRPILIGRDFALIGFKSAVWSERLAIGEAGP